MCRVPRWTIKVHKWSFSTFDILIIWNIFHSRTWKVFNGWIKSLDIRQLSVRIVLRGIFTVFPLLQFVGLLSSFIWGTTFSRMQGFCRFCLFLHDCFLFSLLYSFFFLVDSFLDEILHWRIFEIPPAKAFPDWFSLIISEKSLFVPELSEFAHNFSGWYIFESVSVEFGGMRFVLW